jgi:hypothetical protein
MGPRTGIGSKKVRRPESNGPELAIDNRQWPTHPPARDTLSRIAIGRNDTKNEVKLDDGRNARATSPRDTLPHIGYRQKRHE